MTIGITGPGRKAPRQNAVVGLIIAAFVVGICLILLTLATDFLVDWLWFSSIGYLPVYLTSIGAKAMVFFAVLTATAAILWLNGLLAVRFARRLPIQAAASAWKPPGHAPPTDLFTLIRDRLPRQRVIAAGAAVLALLVAAAEAGNWGVFLQFLYSVPYGASDPLYLKDIGFYLFSLPAYILIKNWMLLTLLLSALFAGTIYWACGDIEYDMHHRSVSPTAIAHGSALFGLLFAVKAWSYGLDRYLLLYGDNGVVVGAGYTDIHVGLPVLWLLIGLSIVAAFIERNIGLTQQAYSLRQITAKPFPAEQDLTFQTLEANKATIDNIRLWDWQPLIDTFAQLQEIRTYYKFHDVDVDRYWLDGAYQSVMLSARELRSSLLPPNAQTWVNRHVLFTHGNGVVMSPVTRKSTEGLPLFYLRDIPPVATGGPEIREPRIYYGEETDSYVIVKGSTPEFD